MSPQDFIAMISSITAFITAIGVLIVNILQNKKTSYLLEYRMGNVERKLDEHNKYAKRFEEIEKTLIAIQKDIGFLTKKAGQK